MGRQTSVRFISIILPRIESWITETLIKYIVMSNILGTLLALIKNYELSAVSN